MADDKVMRAEFQFKEGQRIVATVNGELVLGDQQDLDKELLQMFWELEQRFNDSNRFRLHVMLYNVK